MGNHKANQKKKTDGFYNSEAAIRIGRACRLFDLIVNKYAKYVMIILALLLAAIITGLFVRKEHLTDQARLQEDLAREVLRFHILANSDSEEDQALKMAVKEQVLQYLESEMPETMDVGETKLWMRRHVDELEALSRGIVEAQGYDYPVTAAVTTCWFPEKTYGDVRFPAGNYEALRVEIGAAEGHNWWCVLYPNLCFLDAANAVVPEEGKQKLQNVLTEEEYAEITAGTDFEIRWYIWDRWKKE